MSVVEVMAVIGFIAIMVLMVASGLGEVEHHYENYRIGRLIRKYEGKDSE